LRLKPPPQKYEVLISSAAYRLVRSNIKGDIIMEKENLNRGLSERHIQLIAFGGAIGVGLFLASGKAIVSSGPSLLLSYLIGGIIIYLMMRALGEVAVEYPLSGSFSAYANMFMGPTAGFMVGWGYWFLWVIISMAEVTAIAIYCTFWWPNLPQWIPALGALTCMTFANLLSVKSFGEFQFWCSSIKIATIVAIIIAGISIIFFGAGTPDGHAVGFKNLYTLPGGFFPFGGWGVLESLSIVMFAFIGVEFIGITAGEAKDPQRAIPGAINKVLWRILVFYIGTLFVIMAINPWTSVPTNASVAESPFVLTFSQIGIRQAAGIINFVIITASLSSCNSGMFSNARMLYTLSLQKQAPHFLSNLTKNKIPANALLVSFAVALIGVVMNYIAPSEAFLLLTSISTFLALFSWTMIIIVQMSFRKKQTKEKVDALKFPMPFYPYSGYLVIIVFVFIAALLIASPSSRVSVLLGCFLVIVLFCIHKIFMDGKGKDKDKDKDNMPQPLK
jgi:AAT family amino acid transporter